MTRRVLENDEANPCYGCGPGHPYGLRLEFHEADGVVDTTLQATPERQGWPGRLHSGILYVALLETSNWTLYGLRGRVGVPTRTSALELSRWVATGERLTLRGRIVTGTPERVVIETEALGEDGERVARLERAYDLVDQETFLARMAYDALPPGLEGCFPA